MKRNEEDRNNIINIRSDTLLEALVLFASRFGTPVSKETLIAGLPHDPANKTPDLLSVSQADTLFSRAAHRAGFKARLIKRDLDTVLDLHLPIILLMKSGETCILETFSEDKSRAKVIFPLDGKGIEDWIDTDKLKEEYGDFAIFIKKEIDNADVGTYSRHHRGRHWFWDTIKLSWPIYRDVLLASLLVNLFVLATPLFTMGVYDRVVPNNAIETLMVFAGGVLLVYVLDVFLKFFRTQMLEIAAKKSDIIMSSIIFERVMDLKMDQLPRSVGSFASNIRDFDAIRSFLTNATMAVVIDLPFAVIFLLVIAYIGGKMVFIPLSIMILIVLYAYIIKDPLYRSIESTHEAAARKNGILVESLHQIETIKTQGMSGQVQWEWENSVGDIARKSLKSRLLSASVPMVTGFMVQLNTVLIVIYGVFMIRDLELTMGGLIGVVILSSRTVAPMGQVAALMTNYSDAKSAYDAINAIVHQPVERLEGKHFIHRDRFYGKIEFKNVSFSYPDSDKPALQNVSFKIEAGEHVGIIGRIGSGKSTIIKLILKLYEPDEGMILIDDVDISQIDPARLRRFIGYIGQDVALFRGTLKDNITCRVPGVDDESLLEAARLSGVDEFARQHPMGYAMPIGERGSGLSGGQRQSVGIARALLSDAPIMLMDEPTNAMDQLSESRLLENFRKALANKTVLMSTQKNLLLDLTPRVIVMHEGRLYMDDSREVVINKLRGEKNEA